MLQHWPKNGDIHVENLRGEELTKTRMCYSRSENRVCQWEGGRHVIKLERRPLSPEFRVRDPMEGVVRRGND